MDKIVGILFTVAGVGMLILTFIIGFHTRNFIQTASSTTGTVIGSLGTPHRPIIRFTAPSGKVIQHSDYYNSEYQVGDQVTVLYNPQDPHEACVSSEIDLWSSTNQFLTSGSVFTILGLLLAFKSKLFNFQNSKKGELSKLSSFSSRR